MRIAAAASRARGDSPTKQLGFTVYAIGMASNFICSAYCHHVPPALPAPSVTAQHTPRSILVMKCIDAYL
jgi:hypothetical protein